MQIQNNTTTPSFTAIKSLKCEGLYKKYPQLGQQLVNTLQTNPIAMDFFKKYDVDIVFFARKGVMETVESSINIFYDNPAVSKMQKFIKCLFGKDDKICLTGFGNQYNINQSLEESTKALGEYLVPHTVGLRKSGTLSSHIEFAKSEINNTIANKTRKTAVKKTLAKEKHNAEAALNENQNNLKESIEQLINSTK